jgi:hypothetical protein
LNENNYIFEKYIFEKKDFYQIINNKITEYFDNTGLLNNTIVYDKFKYIDFIIFKFNTIEEPFIMTQNFYEKFKIITDKYISPFIKYKQESSELRTELSSCNKTNVLLQQEINKNKENITYITLSINKDKQNKYISNNRIQEYNDMLNQSFLSELFKFLETNNIKLC